MYVWKEANVFNCIIVVEILRIKFLTFRRNNVVPFEWCPRKKTLKKKYCIILGVIIIHIQEFKLCCSIIYSLMGNLCDDCSRNQTAKCSSSRHSNFHICTHFKYNAERFTGNSWLYLIPETRKLCWNVFLPSFYFSNVAQKSWRCSKCWYFETVSKAMGKKLCNGK